MTGEFEGMADGFPRGDAPGLRGSGDAVACSGVNFRRWQADGFQVTEQDRQQVVGNSDEVGLGVCGGGAGVSAASRKSSFGSGQPLHVGCASAAAWSAAPTSTIDPYHHACRVFPMRGWR